MTDRHAVDSTRHPSGQHALWEEVVRLRGLLREGVGVVGRVPDWAWPHREAHAAACGWHERALRELAEAPPRPPGVRVLGAYLTGLPEKGG